MPAIQARSSILRRRASHALILTLMLGGLSPQPAAAQQTAAEAMAHAIARMMESMGFTANLDQGQGPPLPLSAPGQMPGALATRPDQAIPQASAMADSAWRAMQNASGGAMPWSGTSLEGLWEDNQGGLLIVQGGFYRLYSACRGYVEGEIRLQDTRVELSNRAENFIQTFEFALDQGRLALRDQNGQLYLYRRLVLSPNTAR
ncbi:hypothetical protein [Allochromatium palmeri]|uniref:META domain-containing protein n=1 Tax=Allochromatium palmeri TaxID=231048 RepID=A0A6N8E9C8_9GAMM|nr:hypothetical protein [Allochromatium palmeri]MTW20151.1 hypothetical protein [Allochromatium palmeri]